MNLKSSEEARRAKFEKENNPPPISESLKKLKENAIQRDEIGKWNKREVIVGTDIPSVPTFDDCKEYTLASMSTGKSLFQMESQL